MTPLLRALRPGGALAALLLAAAPIASAQADQTVATTARPTPVAAGQGLVAFSAYDAAIDAYRLTIARGGRTEQPDVAPSSTPFDVDVGPTEGGRPYLVYFRCEEGGGTVPRGCDIYAFDPRSGREKRYDASSSRHSDVHPTYWRGRVAFVRYYGTADDPRPIVYARRARSSQPSERLPGLPDRRCVERRGCGAVRGTIDELELYGEHLAQTASTVTDYDLERRQTELRLVDVETGRSQQLGARGRGESGQAFIGPSFAAGRLYTYFTCRADAGGCVHGIGGAYRYRYSTGGWAKAASTQQLAGFSVADFGTFTQAGNGAGSCGAATGTGAPCRIVRRVPPPDYRPHLEPTALIVISRCARGDRPSRFHDTTTRRRQP
jgi:hypothetical protein